MDTVGTGRASQLRLPERQFGWRPPHPRRRRRPSISGTRFIKTGLEFLPRQRAVLAASFCLDSALSVLIAHLAYSWSFLPQVEFITRHTAYNKHDTG